MKPGLFQQIILYRYRYIVGYSLLVLFAVVIVIWQLHNLGPGLSDAEKSSAISSATWQWKEWKENGLQIVNLPYALLQKLSIKAFGLSIVSVRLPSVVLAMLTSGLFFLLMSRLHRTHAAITASFLFVATTWYLAIGRYGTPLIMIPFMWTLFIYSFVRLVRLDDPGLAWAALAGLAGVGALYIPYGVYALLVASIIVAIHPQIRRNVSAISGQQVVLALFIIIPLLIPLGWGIYKHPDQFWQLTGLSSQLPTAQEFVRHIGQVFLAIVWRSPELPALRLGTLPLLDVGTVALLGAGIYRACADWRSMRTQFMLLSCCILLVVIGLNPQDKNYIVLLVPLYLLVATGVTVLFREWYKLFPRNPYARSFGLIPIVAFLAFVVAYHYQRYFVAWSNTSATYYAYDSDIALAKKQLSSNPATTIVVKPDDQALYQLFLPKYPQATVTTSIDAINSMHKPALVQNAVAPPQVSPQNRIKPIVNADNKDALRFWLITSAKQ